MRPAAASMSRVRTLPCPAVGRDPSPERRPRAPLVERPAGAASHEIERGAPACLASVSDSRSIRGGRRGDVSRHATDASREVGVVRGARTEAGVGARAGALGCGREGGRGGGGRGRRGDDGRARFGSGTSPARGGADEGSMCAARTRGAGDTVAGTPRRAVRVHAREGVGARPSGLRRAKGAEDETTTERCRVWSCAKLLRRNKHHHGGTTARETRTGTRPRPRTIFVARWSRRGGRATRSSCVSSSFVSTITRTHPPKAASKDHSRRSARRPAGEGRRGGIYAPRRPRLDGGGASSPSSPSSDPTRHPRTPFRCPGRADPGEGTA